MKKISLPLLLLPLLLTFSCRYGLHEFVGHDENVQKRASQLTEITGEDLPGAAGGTYNVLLLSDIHFGKPKPRHDGQFLDWLEENKSELKFCINLGDTADHGLGSELDDYLAFEQKITAKLGAPHTYPVIGNHDLYNSGWKQWKEKMYPNTSFYHFTLGAFSYYFLDSGSSILGTPQMDVLKSEMRKDTRPKIVCTHYPVYAATNNSLSLFVMQDMHETDELISLFEETNVKIVLVGHTHIYYETRIGSFKEFNVPGFLDAKQWAVLTVDEANETVSARIVTYPE